MSWDVVRKIPELEALVDHLVVVEACSHLTVHLCSLFRFISIVIFDRPLCPAHPLEHVDGKHAHQKVEHVVDQDPYYDRIEIVRVTIVPAVDFFRERIQICLGDLDSDNNLKQSQDENQDKVD